LNDLFGDITVASMDVDVDRCGGELNVYTRVQQVMVVLTMSVTSVSQYLTMSVTSVSPERLFSSVGIVKSDLRGKVTLNSTWKRE
jgi:hypothetical protein